MFLCESEEVYSKAREIGPYTVMHRLCRIASSQGPAEFMRAQFVEFVLQPLQQTRALSARAKIEWEYWIVGGLQRLDSLENSIPPPSQCVGCNFKDGGELFVRGLFARQQKQLLLLWRE